MTAQGDMSLKYTCKRIYLGISCLCLFNLVVSPYFGVLKIDYSINSDNPDIGKYLRIFGVYRRC